MTARTPLLFAASIVVAFAAWQFLSTVIFNPFLIPPPLVVFKTMVPMVENGEIFRHVGISLARVGVGFVTGSAAAIVLGVILGRVKLVNDLLDPVIELLRYLSPTAMIPMSGTTGTFTATRARGLTVFSSCTTCARSSIE